MERARSWIFLHVIGEVVGGISKSNGCIFKYRSVKWTIYNDNGMESTLPREGVPLSFHALTSGNNQHDYKWLWKISWGKSLQSGENLKTFVWLGQVCAPRHTNVCKIWWLWGATSLLVVNKSLSNLTILLNALFPAESTVFLWLNRKKKLKKKKLKKVYLNCLARLPWSTWSAEVLDLCDFW